MNVAVFIERDWEGRPAVFRHALKNVQARDVNDIQMNSISPIQTKSIFDFPDVRRAMWMSKWLPFPILRGCFQLAYSLSGSLRSELYGCASVNLMNLGRTRCLQSVTITSFVIYPGTVGESGDVVVQAFVDHRVIDGLQSMRVLRDIESIINNEIVAEMRNL